MAVVALQGEPQERGAVVETVFGQRTAAARADGRLPRVAIGGARPDPQTLDSPEDRPDLNGYHRPAS